MAAEDDGELTRIGFLMLAPDDILFSASAFDGVEGQAITVHVGEEHLPGVLTKARVRGDGDSAWIEVAFDLPDGVRRGLGLT